MYHFSTKTVSRGKGQSAVASASYRSGTKLEDKRIGKTFDYTKRSGLVFEACFDKKGKAIDRNELWNLAESSENRKDARVAREYVIALPHSLIEEKGLEEAIKLSSHISLLIANKYDCAVDIAIHKPDKKGDKRNYHVHVLTTTRKFERTNEGIKLTDKTDIELSNKKLKEKDLKSTQEQIKELREIWADTANQYLSAENKIDHRSYKDQNKDQIPTVKLGWKASDMERKGIKTDRGDINRDIINRNKQIKKLKEEIEEDKQLLLEERKQQRLRNEKFEPVIEPLSIQKTDIGWSLYDNYKLLSNIHNDSIDNIKNGLYNKQEATEVMQYFYEVAQQVYTDVESNKDNLHLSKTQIEKVKKSTDEIKGNYSKFINKTILKDEQSIIDARNRADKASSKCLSNEYQKPIETAETKPEQPNPSPTFRP